MSRQASRSGSRRSAFRRGVWTDGWINIGVHSNHLAVWHHSIGQRLARAWSALRNRDAEGYLDFHSRAAVDEFVDCLLQAREVTFPPDGR